MASAASGPRRRALAGACSATGTASRRRRRPAPSAPNIVPARTSPAPRPRCTAARTRPPAAGCAPAPAAHEDQRGRPRRHRPRDRRRRPQARGRASGTATPHCPDTGCMPPSRPGCTPSPGAGRRTAARASCAARSPPLLANVKNQTTCRTREGDGRRGVRRTAARRRRTAAPRHSARACRVYGARGQGRGRGSRPWRGPPGAARRPPTSRTPVPVPRPDQVPSAPCRLRSGHLELPCPVSCVPVPAVCPTAPVTGGLPVS
ncbi:hypothetical protein STANM309S_05879 [Streptomyces tanashiensis]